MREILFRGKSAGSGDWVYGYLNQHRGDVTYDVYEEAVYGLDYYICDWSEKIDTGCYGVNYKVIPETVGQFTGLTDKNGVKIFEGDIVMFNRKRSLPNYTPVPELIKHHQGDCAFQRYPFGKSITKGKAGKLIQPDMMSECEVIGNVHDNPELLESVEVEK